MVFGLMGVKALRRVYHLAFFFNNKKGALFVLVFVVFSFETGSYYVTPVDLELLGSSLLPQSPEHWDLRCTLSRWAVLNL